MTGQFPLQVHLSGYTIAFLTGGLTEWWLSALVVLLLELIYFCVVTFSARCQARPKGIFKKVTDRLQVSYEHYYLRQEVDV